MLGKPVGGPRCICQQAWQQAHLDMDQGGQPFADVVATEVWVTLLEGLASASLDVEGARECALEPIQVRATIDGLDIVHKAHQQI